MPTSVLLASLSAVLAFLVRNPAGLPTFSSVNIDEDLVRCEAHDGKKI